MAELVSAGASPGALASGPDGGVTALDQHVELVLVARLVERVAGTVWGPASYRISLRVPDGPGATASRAIAGAALERVCAETARRVVEDLALDVVDAARAPAGSVTD